jgi:broad specificity phosphatase PhoE
MPNLYLVRHGENEYTREGRLAGRQPGVHLNARGNQQAVAIATYLADVKFQAIYSSPLERAIETIQPLASNLNIPIQIRDGLNETDVGEWENKLLKDLRKMPEWKILERSPSRMVFPSGESHVVLLNRLVGEVDILCRSNNKGDNLLLCFHADPIKMMIAHFIGLPLDAFNKLVIDTGSISILKVEQYQSQLILFNLIP